MRSCDLPGLFFHVDGTFTENQLYDPARILSKAYRRTNTIIDPPYPPLSSLLWQAIVNGQFERHLRRLRKKCSARMKAFIAATNHHRKDINIYPTDTGTFVLLEARNQQIFEAIRKNSILMRLGLREVWEGYFAFEYANIQEEKFPGLLKEMIQIC